MALLAGDPAVKSIFYEFWDSIREVQHLLEAGDHAGGAERFVETVALGPGMWSHLPPPMQEMFVRHGPTFLGEMHDADALTSDVEALGGVSTPVLLSQGDQGPPMFAPIIERVARLLPGADRHTFTGAGHVPQLTHPEDYIAVVARFLHSP